METVRNLPGVPDPRAILENAREARRRFARKLDARLKDIGRLWPD